MLTKLIITGFIVFDIYFIVDTICKAKKSNTKGDKNKVDSENVDSVNAETEPLEKGDTDVTF
jgi:hypothetical protein